MLQAEGSEGGLGTGKQEAAIKEVIEQELREEGTVGSKHSKAAGEECNRQVERSTATDEEQGWCRQVLAQLLKAMYLWIGRRLSDRLQRVKRRKQRRSARSRAALHHQRCGNSKRRVEAVQSSEE